MLGTILGGFVIILVGTSLLPSVAQAVWTATNDSNVSQSSASVVMMNLIPMFFALMVAGAGVMTAYYGLANSGLI